MVQMAANLFVFGGLHLFTPQNDLLCGVKLEQQRIVDSQNLTLTLKFGQDLVLNPPSPVRRASESLMWASRECQIS